MGRPPRYDRPGFKLHVFNRGLGHRPAFEDVGAIRVFGSMLEKQVRQGLIEVLSYCFMTTHFHLLLASPLGRLSEAMRNVESTYVRYFNRRHDRDGALFRGRFGSKLVVNEEYLRVLHRYIDHNPVAAGMVERPEDYPHGSAAAFLRGPKPVWLSSRWIEEDLEYWTLQGMSLEQAYRHVYGQPSSDEVFLVEQRMRLKSRAEDPLDDLIGAAPEGVREWMRRRAKLADGGAVGLPVTGPDAVGRSVRSQESKLGPRRILLAKRRTPAWPLIEAGLLRELCAMSFEQIARHLGCSISTAAGRCRRHREARERSPEYEHLVTTTAAEALIPQKGV